MGNSFTCFSLPSEKEESHPSPPPHLPPPSSRPPARKPPNDQILDDSYIKQQAQIASMLYHHHLQSNSDLLLHLNRSVSTRNPPSASRKPKNPSSAIRSRSVSTSSNYSHPSNLHLFDQDFSKGDQEGQKRHFLLVHGGGFGAWCWYKIIALLKDAKCEVEAIDLAGSGSNFCDINSILTLAQFAKPLLDFLSALEDGKEVILVGHDIGGACISYAMELYPTKVSKAVFVAATMLSNGQSALDVFSHQKLLSDLNQRAQKFLYANGKDHPPTAIEFDKPLLEDFLFNRTPSKDIALSSVSMRTVPFAPLTEKLSLSESNYGSIPRFYVKTEDDSVIPTALQEYMIDSNQPTRTFQLKGSDHSPFFSKPQALQKILLDVSNLP